MRTKLTTVCAITCFLGWAPFATGQDKSTASKESKEVQQDTKTVTQGHTAKTSTDTVNGKVEGYDVGKSIKVTVPGKIVSTKSFDLDDKNTTVNIPHDVKVGDWVTVAEKTDNNGHKTVTIRHSSEKHAARAKRETQ